MTSTKITNQLRTIKNFPINKGNSFLFFRVNCSISRGDFYYLNFLCDDFNIIHKE